MANISEYIKALEVASRGEEVREPIINALTAINENGGDADTLDGHDASYYAKKESLEAKQDKLSFDTVPTQNSNNPVYSYGLYNILNTIITNLNKINGEVVGDDYSTDT